MPYKDYSPIRFWQRFQSFAFLPGVCFDLQKTDLSPFFLCRAEIQNDRPLGFS